MHRYTYENNINIHTKQNDPSSSDVSSRLEFFERKCSLFYGKVRPATMTDNRVSTVLINCFIKTLKKWRTIFIELFQK